jgi:hypothetical protein
VFPVLQTVIAWTVLVVCLVLTTNSHFLLKSSVIAYLFYGLNGWADRDVAIHGVETQEKLEKISREMKTVFGIGDGGAFRFRRVE